MKEEYLPKTPEGRAWRLVEECNEVRLELALNRTTHAACKLGRFGPDGDAQVAAIGSTPRERLLAELADLEHAIAAVRADLARSSDRVIWPCAYPDCECDDGTGPCQHMRAAGHHRFPVFTTREERTQAAIDHGDVEELLALAEGSPCACLGAVDNEPRCACEMTSAQVRRAVSLAALHHGKLVRLK